MTHASRSRGWRSRRCCCQLRTPDHQVHSCRVRKLRDAGLARHVSQDMLAAARRCDASEPFMSEDQLALLPDRYNGHVHGGRRLNRPPKPDGWSSASDGTTLQSTAVGLIWRSPNSGCFRPSASTAGFPTNKPSSRKSPHGSKTAMPTTQTPTGNSQHKCPYETQALLPINLNESGA
jgi:hypothetical protein